MLQSEENKIMHNLYRLGKVECHYLISAHFSCCTKHFTLHSPLAYTNRENTVVNFALKQLMKQLKLNKKI